MTRSIVAEGNLKYQTGVMYDPVTQTFAFIPSLIYTQPNGTKEMILSEPHNSYYFIVETDGRTYTDIQVHWAKAEIETLASKYIVNGVSDTLFAPDSEITRAEFAALVVRSLGLSASQKRVNSRFMDVGVDAWYAQVVEIAAEAGLVQGIGVNQFAPNEKINREQMAVIVFNAMKLAGAPAIALEENDVLGKYTDHDKIAGWAKHAVAETSAAEMIQGYPDRTFAPQRYVTRAEVAAILKRFLQFVSFI